MQELTYPLLALVAAVVLIALAVRLALQTRELRDLAARQSDLAEQRHHAMLVDLHDGLAKQGGSFGGRAHRKF